MEILNFKEFLLATEDNVPGYHLDGNSGFTGTTGGGFLDSQQTGSETQSKAGDDGGNIGLSPYSTDLGLPTRIERGRVVMKVDDRPKYRLSFRDGGYVEFDRDEWHKVARGKVNIHDIMPGDRADVEYYTNRFDNSRKPNKVIMVQVY